jgi:hypothetical protein
MPDNLQQVVVKLKILDGVPQRWSSNSCFSRPLGGTRGKKITVRDKEGLGGIKYKEERESDSGRRFLFRVEEEEGGGGEDVKRCLHEPTPQ